MNRLLRVSAETFDSLRACYENPVYGLEWSTVFVTPPFLEAWWQSFGAADVAALTGIHDGEAVIGIAPLRLRGDTALFIGSPNVCDYLDCVVRPGRETDFYAALLDDLAVRGVSALELHSLRPESSVMQHLLPLAHRRGLEVSLTGEDCSMELEIFGSWEEYLDALDKKQRHELRRKRRNLEKAGSVSYTTITDAPEIEREMDRFLAMFRESREEKAAFLTADMDGFLRRLVTALAEAGVVRLGVLGLDGRPVAMVLCFDHEDRLNLYNSGYDTDYRELSVGLLCKAYSIEETIRRGMRYDFLRGREVYKYRLGAREVPLHRLRISLS